MRNTLQLTYGEGLNMDKINMEIVKEGLDICAKGGPCEACYVEESYPRCVRVLCQDAADLMEELMDEIGERDYYSICGRKLAKQ